MNNYSLVRFFFGGVCKPISRQPAIAERSPKLESDGLEPVSALILGRLLHHFEPFFFFFILKTESENLCPTFPGITVKGKNKMKKKVYIIALKTIKLHTNANLSPLKIFDIPFRENHHIIVPFSFLKGGTYIIH